jgi:signal transduction histidine kinase
MGDACFSMNHWILPSLSDILAIGDSSPQEAAVCAWRDSTAVVSPQLSIAQQRVRAEREWSGAIVALEILLLSHPMELAFGKGLVISCPVPVLSQPRLLDHFSTWSFTADPLATMTWLPFQLLPAGPSTKSRSSSTTLPLLPVDPLAAEQFCLVLTAQFSLVLLLGEDGGGHPVFRFSFDPEEIERAWQVLRFRVMLMSPGYIAQLDAEFKQFPPIAPDYKIVTRFSHLMLTQLALPIADSLAPTPTVSPQSVPSPVPCLTAVDSPDIELLQAIAHEVRTPLATIRTLTRSLLKRLELSPDIVKRLEMIDRECSEQIDRFGLIFRAVELETSATPVTALTATSLAEVLQQSMPRWQKQASQRSLTLEVILPPQMPRVVSDPTMLDQALTSLIDRAARSLPSGSHIQVEVSLAGDQLKLQVQSQWDADSSTGSASGTEHYRPCLKSLGQLLMFQPETGSLSLNMAVTKNLFQALGGKLIVRERPEQGEVLTIFLPLEIARQDAAAGPSVLDRQPIINA